VISFNRLQEYSNIMRGPFFKMGVGVLVFFAFILLISFFSFKEDPPPIVPKSPPVEEVFFENTEYPQMNEIKCWNTLDASKCYYQDPETLECYLILENDRGIALIDVECKTVLRDLNKE